MQRRKLIKVLGLSAFAVSSSGFTLLTTNGKTTTSCRTSQDMLGPFFKEGAPYRNDLRYEGNEEEIPLKVVGTLFSADCVTPLSNVTIDIWHCDHRKEYDMEEDSYRCRGKITTNQEGFYEFITFVPPPYGGRPKHIHYLIKDVEGYESLATQLYFKGDKRIKANNWIKFPWDEKRILDVYKNEENMSEVSLDIFLSPKSKR